METFTGPQATQVMKQLGEKAPPKDQMDILLGGFWTDLLEAARSGILGDADRTAIQRALGSRSFFQPTNDLGDTVIRIPAQRRVRIKTIQKRYPNYGIECIEQDSSPTVPVVLELGTVFVSGEREITGAEYERRLGSVTDKLGYQHLQWLVDNQDDHPDLVRLFGGWGIDGIYIHGPGTKVSSRDGSRYTPCLRRGEEGLLMEWDVIHFARNEAACVSFCRIARARPRS